MKHGSGPKIAQTVNLGLMAVPEAFSAFSGPLGPAVPPKAARY
ncbi:hypothetical protein [Nocardiopsis valliformis]|nr:hypothetical protein [Nocardiopsis valliformis]